MKLSLKVVLMIFGLIQTAQAGRMFDANQGRFLSRDAQGYVDGMSLYNGYFAEKMMLDPTGRQATELPPAIGPANPNPHTGVGVVAGPDDNIATTVRDFFNGGPATDWYFNYPHPVTKRLLEQTPFKEFYDIYNNRSLLYKWCKCVDDDFSGNIQQSTGNRVFEQEYDGQFVAPGINFLSDVYDVWGAFGEGTPHNDWGLNIFGSYAAKIKLRVDCENRTASLNFEAWNSWSMASLTRLPIVRDFSFITNNALNPVTITLQGSLWQMW